METLRNEFYWINSGSVGITIEFFQSLIFCTSTKIYSPSLNSWSALFGFVVWLFGFGEIKSCVSWIFVAVAAQPTSSTVVVVRSKRSTCLGHLLKINSQTLGRSRRYILLHTVIIFSYSYWGFQFLTCLGPNIIIFRCRF